MSDYRSEEYCSDECAKCSRYNKCENHYKKCSNYTTRSRSCSPEKCSSYSDNECDCYKISKKCKCQTKPPNECEKKCCKCSSYKVCKKKEKYDVCNRVKLFEDGVFNNAKNEKIFFITIG